MNITRRHFLGALGMTLAATSIAVAKPEGAIQAHGFEAGEIIPLSVEEQLTVYSCGLACLVSVMNYWGVDADQQYLLDRYPPKHGSRGYSMGELKSIAAEHSAKAYNLQGGFNFLRQQIAKGRPLITPLLIPYGEFEFKTIRSIPGAGNLFSGLSRRFSGAYSHFVAVSAIGQGRVLFMNPMYGLQEVEESRFLDMWEKKKQSILFVTS